MEDSSVASTKPEILKKIERFYLQLYASIANPVNDLAKDPRAKLTRHYTEDIPDISLYEIRMALKQFKNNKVAGDDGITSEKRGTEAWWSSSSKKLGETLSACSHKRGLKYYIESIIHSTCYFLGFSCSNIKDFIKGKCSTCGDKLQSCSRMPVVAKKARGLNNSLGFYFVTSNSAPFCVEVLKVLMVIKSKFSHQSFVKGYFNITIPQDIGNVNFFINENHAINALDTDDHHVFMVFRTVPPPLVLPSEAVHIKWIQGPLPSPWSTPPVVTGFMVYKMSDYISRPQWFCPVNGSPSQSLGLGLEPCKTNYYEQAENVNWPYL